MGLPLYLDTVFTIALTFSFGLLPGLLTGALIYPLFVMLHRLILNTGSDTLVVNAFVLCTVSEVLLVTVFRRGIEQASGPPLSSRKFPRESSLLLFTGTAARLMVLLALDCILVSIVGGLVDFALHDFFAAPRRPYPEDIFKLSLFRNRVPVLAAAILSRIPINIVDRFIAVFGGYGVSLLYRRLAARGCRAPSRRRRQ